MIEENEFLGRFEGVRPSNGGWIARCPAHGDRNASLSIGRGSGGRWLLKCFAGCDTRDVVAAAGLEMKDLMPEDTTTKYAKNAKGGGGNKEGGVSTQSAQKPRREAQGAATSDGGERLKRRFVAEKEYIYTDEAGQPLHKTVRGRAEYVDGAGEVQRVEKKQFQQMRWDANSIRVWEFGLHSKDAERRLLVKYCVPYRLPEVIAAAKAGKWITVMEGEKDVDNFVAATGACGTTGAAGSMKWARDWPEDWVKWFAGAKGIIIIADKDPKTKRDERTGEEKPHWKGQRHAWDVAEKLRKAGYAGKIRLAVLPDVEGRAVKDFTDWKEAREAAGLLADKAAFLEAVKGFGEWPEEWKFAGSAGDFSTTKDAKDAKDGSGNGGGTGYSVEETAGGRYGRFGKRCEDGVWRLDFPLNVAGKYAAVELRDGGDAEKMGREIYSAAAAKIEQEGLATPRDLAARIKAWRVVVWMLMHGRFFAHKRFMTFETCMYLDEAGGRRRLMKLLDAEMLVHIASAAKMEDVEPKRGDMAKAMGLIKQAAMMKRYSEAIEPGNGWEVRDRTVYISCGESWIMRVCGGKIEKVPNGTDGIVFARNSVLEEWELKPGRGIDPVADAMLFKDASYKDANGAMNLRLWMLAMFQFAANKPVLLITGDAGSGKTRLAKGIKEILQLRRGLAVDVAVQTLGEGDKGKEDYDVALENAKLEIFDNLDENIKWFVKQVQGKATGSETRKRALYSDSEEAVLRPRSAQIVTSNNPAFITEGKGGVADRMIIVRLESKERVSKDMELTREILSKRDEYLTWIVKTLAVALADGKEDEGVLNSRFPDYARFALKLGRAFGDEAGARQAMEAAETEKSLIQLQEDLTAKAILSYLRGEAWHWGPGYAQELADKVAESDGGDEKAKEIYTARRLGKVIGKYERHFKVFLKYRSSIVQGKTRYEFNGLTAAGERAFITPSAPASSAESGGAEAAAGGARGFPAAQPPHAPLISDNSGGLGGLKTSFLPYAHARDATRAGADAQTNPPNPPARDMGAGAGASSRAGDISSFSREEEEREEEWDI